MSPHGISHQFRGNRPARCAATALTRRLPTLVLCACWSVLRQVSFNSQPTYVYAYARQAVADCPQGQLCDPAPPRSYGAYGAVANDGEISVRLAPLARARER